MVNILTVTNHKNAKVIQSHVPPRACVCTGTFESPYINGIRLCTLSDQPDEENNRPLKNLLFVTTLYEWYSPFNSVKHCGNCMYIQPTSMFSNSALGLQNVFVGFA